MGSGAPGSTELSGCWLGKLLKKLLDRFVDAVAHREVFQLVVVDECLYGLAGREVNHLVVMIGDQNGLIDNVDFGTLGCECLERGMGLTECLLKKCWVLHV